jgi:hypothetical protein
MEIRYEIDEKNEVVMWYVGEEIPFARQPDRPDGTPWKDRKEAEKWAKDLIAETHKNIPVETPANPVK